MTVSWFVNAAHFFFSSATRSFSRFFSCFSSATRSFSRFFSCFFFSSASRFGLSLSIENLSSHSAPSRGSVSCFALAFSVALSSFFVTFWAMSALVIAAATSDHLVPLGDASALPSTGVSGWKACLLCVAKALCRAHRKSAPWSGYRSQRIPCSCEGGVPFDEGKKVLPDPIVVYSRLWRHDAARVAINAVHEVQKRVLEVRFLLRTAAHQNDFDALFSLKNNNILQSNSRFCLPASPCKLWSLPIGLSHA
jgi:hypothetical protein